MEQGLTTTHVFIHHSPCMDGYASAYIAWLHAKQNNYEWQFIGIPTSHTPPAVETLAGKNVVMADICFGREYIEQLHKAAASLLILDHHETNQKHMAGLPYAQFDMQMAGCWADAGHGFPIWATCSAPIPTRLRCFGHPRLAKGICTAFRCVLPRTAQMWR